MERKFLDFSLPGSECSTERKFHGSESSLYGLFAPGNESAEERKGQLPTHVPEIGTESPFQKTSTINWHKNRALFCSLPKTAPVLLADYVTTRNGLKVASTADYNI